MREIRRSAIIPYPPEAMFDLVADVDAYIEFVPGCTLSRVESTERPDEVIVSLGLSQGGLSGQFTTRNRLQRPHRIHMTLVDGLFSELEGDWEIEALGDDGCRLDLTLRFAFSNRIKDMLLGPVFEQTCSRLVDAFVARAGELYGE